MKIGFHLLSSLEKRLVFFSLAPVIALFFFSYTQVDLNLTLNRLALWQSIQHAFQYLGFFNRPLSTFLYIGILTALLFVYGTFLRLALKKRISKRAVWVYLLISTPILALSYNAFSYDLFNYIFDAKIVTFYHQNPYLHRALDFPGDPMLHFMRWTHRKYPYGPVWLAVTVPFSFTGHQVFLPTLIIFKLFIAGCFLGTTYYIGKIMEVIKPEREIVSIIFFALNPLIIIESLISSHNDIVMLFFMMLAMFLLIKRRFILSVIVFLISIGTKFATAFVVPIMGILYYLSLNKQKINWEFFMSIATGFMSAAVIAATLNSGNFQPWYLLYITIFASLVTTRYYVSVPAVLLSVGGVLTYVPYLYYGNSDQPTQFAIRVIMWSALMLSAILVMMIKSKRLPSTIYE